MKFVFDSEEVKEAEMLLISAVVIQLLYAGTYFYLFTGKYLYGTYLNFPFLLSGSDNCAVLMLLE